MLLTLVRQSVKVVFSPDSGFKSTPTPAPAPAPKLASLVDCLLHPDISSIINSLAPFSKLIGFITLDDHTLLKFEKDRGTSRASSLVPTLVSSVVRTEKWLSSLFDEMRRVQNMNKAAEASSPGFDLSYHSNMLLREFCECISTFRLCLERKVIALLHGDLGQALETILQKRSPQILVTIGQYLIKICSDQASVPIGHSASITRTATARAEVTCSLCNARPLFKSVQLQGKGHICLHCHASVSQTHSVRSCDLLSFYALKLLRGEAKPDDTDMNAVLKVFEYAYPSSEFSASKAALICISSTLKVFGLSSSTDHSRDVAEVILPRWVAQSLFPEYAANIRFNLGPGSSSQFAATLGWCTSSSHPSCTLTPLESAVLAALSGSSDQSSSLIASKSGSF